MVDFRFQEVARERKWDQVLLLARHSAAQAAAALIDSFGRTPLHYAAGYGAPLHVLEDLIHLNIDVNAQDVAGMTALHWACLKEETSIVVALVRDYFADPLIQATKGLFKGRTPLQIAAKIPDGAMLATLERHMGSSLYELRKVVGRGGYASVIKAKRRDSGAVVALKAVRKRSSESKCSIDAAHREHAILADMVHPFIVRLQCAFQTRQHLYLCMEYCSGGDLASYMRKLAPEGFTSPVACFIASELLLALEYIHDCGVLHRDVKTENVLIDDRGHIRLADLNVAKQLLDSTEDRTYTMVGTPLVTAPEVLRGGGHSRACDWWSFGVLIFELVAARLPFPANDALKKAPAKVVYEILHGQRAALPTNISEATSQLIDKLLQRDEQSRLSTANAVRNQAFFENVDWSLIYARQISSPLLEIMRENESYRDDEGLCNRPSNMMHMRSLLPTCDPMSQSRSTSKEDTGRFTVDAFGGHETGDDAQYEGLKHLHSEELKLSETCRSSETHRSNDLVGWDYLAASSSGHGLLEGLRARLDHRARLVGMSRMEYLTAKLLTLADEERR